MKLSIGAGLRRMEGWTHVDIDPALQPDIEKLAARHPQLQMLLNMMKTGQELRGR